MVRVWLIMLAVGLLTFGMRLSLIALAGRLTMPPVIQRALRYVPPAVLSAIVFPELFLQAGQFDLSLNNERLIAGLLAAVVAWRTRNVLLTIAAGMAVLLLLS
jgi:branched-subunit amino acid transport protein